MTPVNHALAANPAIALLLKSEACRTHRHWIILSLNRHPNFPSVPLRSSFHRKNHRYFVDTGIVNGYANFDDWVHPKGRPKPRRRRIEQAAAGAGFSAHPRRLVPSRIRVNSCLFVVELHETAQRNRVCALMCTSAQSRAPACGKPKNFGNGAQTAQNCTCRSLAPGCTYLQ